VWENGGCFCGASREIDDSHNPNLNLVNGSSSGLEICALVIPAGEVQYIDTIKNERLVVVLNLCEEGVEMPFGLFWRGGVWRCIFGVYIECGLKSFCLLPQQIKFLL